MSEAKDLKDSVQHNEPEIFSEKFPQAQPISAHAASTSTHESHDDSNHTDSEQAAGLLLFFENTANLLLKGLLVSFFAFAAGAGLAILILMDLLDHKSGWLKGLLQFIKETSKIFIK